MRSYGQSFVAPFVIQVRMAVRSAGRSWGWFAGIVPPHEPPVHCASKLLCVPSSLYMSQLAVGSPGVTRFIVGSSVLATFTRFA